jgi:hypothetical protein
MDTGRPPGEERWSATVPPPTVDWGQQYPVTVSYAIWRTLRASLHTECAGVETNQR